MFKALTRTNVLDIVQLYYNKRSSMFLAMFAPFGNRNLSNKVNLSHSTQSLLREIKRSLQDEAAGSEVVKKIDSTLEAIESLCQKNFR